MREGKWKHRIVFYDVLRGSFLVTTTKITVSRAFELPDFYPEITRYHESHALEQPASPKSSQEIAEVSQHVMYTIHTVSDGFRLLPATLHASDPPFFSTRSPLRPGSNSSVNGSEGTSSEISAVIQNEMVVGVGGLLVKVLAYRQR